MRGQTGGVDPSGPVLFGFCYLNLSRTYSERRKSIKSCWFVAVILLKLMTV
jgi:hypothetical protein